MKDPKFVPPDYRLPGTGIRRLLKDTGLQALQMVTVHLI